MPVKREIKQYTRCMWMTIAAAVVFLLGLAMVVFGMFIYFINIVYNYYFFNCNITNIFLVFLLVYAIVFLLGLAMVVFGMFY